MRRQAQSKSLTDQNMRDLIVNMIVQDGQPFSIVQVLDLFCYLLYFILIYVYMNEGCWL